ncbi:CheR family methyltransferase [Candidatus Magnetaquicoccus inordinatus]|uniref:CheR family methyltransferase n=1 Tax=Candidatus Magnetaquicoccus inordinatus TaxID=2496818 RepID=UPI00102CE314|nr:protein-glutamate O-methyltransferase CheR [Candidatus Magnetaquicoccus inordinatus]
MNRDPEVGVVAPFLDPLDQDLLLRIIQQRLGFHFSEERLPDLFRALREMAADRGLSSVDKLVKWLLYQANNDEQLQIMARYLTIGESYFFRDEKNFERLIKTILPPLLHQAKTPLTVWSAGCSTGEEPYTMAIMLAMHGLAESDVRIIASDVNPDALSRAVLGRYTSWSFRHALPEVQKRFFQRTPDNQWQICDSIRSRVCFLPINLVENNYPAPLDQPQSVAVIFCRNVLMYFSPGHREQIVGQLAARLHEGGWLIVSPSEAALIRHRQLLVRQAAEPNLFYKNSLGESLPLKRYTPAPSAPTHSAASSSWSRPSSAAARRTPVSHSRELQSAPVVSSGRDALLLEAEQLFLANRLSESADLLERQREESAPSLARTLLLARIQANLGRLEQAEKNYRQAIAQDRLQAEYYYQLAMILLAKGERDEAETVLEQVLFLQPDMVIAHLQLATLCRDKRRARKHVATLWQLLKGSAAEMMVPHTEGMTVQTIRQIVQQLEGVLHA